MHKSLSDMSGCRTLVLLSAFETNSVKLNRNTTISIKKMEFQNGNHFGPCMYVSVFGMCLENDCQPNNWNRKGDVRKVPKKGWARGVWCMKTNAFRTCGSHYGLNIQTRMWIDEKYHPKKLWEKGQEYSEKAWVCAKWQWNARDCVTGLHDLRSQECNSVQGSHVVLISWKSTYFWSWVLRSWKSPQFQ